MTILALLIAASINCNNPITQADMTQCAHRESILYDKQLANVWKRAQEWAKGEDRDLDRTYDKRPTNSQRLLESQRAWIIYKDSHCDMESWKYRGGSMEPMIYSMCTTAVTKRRIKELQEMIS